MINRKNSFMDTPRSDALSQLCHQVETSAQELSDAMFQPEQEEQQRREQEEQQRREHEEQQRREQEEQQRREHEKQLRLQTIERLVTDENLKKILKSTTPDTTTLTIGNAMKRNHRPNEVLNDNWNTVTQLLPQLKILTLDGKDRTLVSTRKGIATALHPEIFEYFKRNLDEIDLSNNYIEDLSRLREADETTDNFSLKKLNLTGNHIQSLNYDDFKHLPEGAEVIIKNNPINRNADQIQAFEDGLRTSGVKAKFIF
jgi:Leucine-rich repeat (LRR) protein